MDAEYAAKYPAIQQPGLGILQFTDAGGATNHTDLRKYALRVDYEIKRIDILMRLGYLFLDDLEQEAIDRQEDIFSGDVNNVNPQKNYKRITYRYIHLKPQEYYAESVTIRDRCLCTYQ